MVEGQLRDSTRSIPIFFLHNENQSTIKIQTYTSGNPPKSDGVDETGAGFWSGVHPGLPVAADTR